VKGRGVPEWLQFDAEGMSAKIGSVPTRAQDQFTGSGTADRRVVQQVEIGVGVI
jgi:hypothetical protein